MNRGNSDTLLLVAAVGRSMARVDNSFLTCDTFAQCAGIHPATVRGLAEKMGYTAMSKVQSLTVPHGIQGSDIVAKAQTGTGKTIAFLIPVINRAATRGPSQELSGIILSPTRELAAQIFTEATALLTFHKGLTVAVIVGGTNMGKDVKTLQRVDILVATPGRLLDHLANTPGFASRVRNLDTFTLDEADRMLDMGFRPDLERIVAACGGPHKQTLLFSATIAREVIELAPKLLTSRFIFVDAGSGKSSLATTQAGSNDGAMRLVADDPFVTAKQVKQEFMVVEQEIQINTVVDILLKERQVPNHKVMVFFTTARVTQLFSELFVALGCPVLEIHSRKSQSHRQKTSDTFRDSTNVIMFSSDVTARGLDYPDVTLVLQVGLPASAEQYVHRLGRTGRAGMKGHGILVLMPEEKFFMRQLEQLQIQEVKPAAAQVPASVIADAMHRVSADTRCMAYSAWLGFYNSFASKLRWSKEYLVQRANQFSVQALGFDKPPALEKKTIGKMGLKGVPGLNIQGSNSAEGAPARVSQPSNRSQGRGGAQRPQAQSAPLGSSPAFVAPQGRGGANVAPPRQAAHSQGPVGSIPAHTAPQGRGGAATASGPIGSVLANAPAAHRGGSQPTRGQPPAERPSSEGRGQGRGPVTSNAQPSTAPTDAARGGRGGRGGRRGGRAGYSA